MTLTAPERERHWMTLREQIVFLVTPLHSGALNLTLHVLSLPLLLLGGLEGSHALVAWGFGLEVAGHAYDFVLRFDRTTRLRVLQVLWIQILGGAAAAMLLLG